MQQPINLMHIISGDIWGGAEAQAFDLLRMLVENTNWNIRVIVFNSSLLSEKLRHHGIETVLIDEKTTPPYTMIKEIRKQIKQHNINIIHTHGYKENILGNISNLFISKTKSIRTAHGNPEFRTSWKAPQKIIFKYLDLIIGKLLQQKIIAVSSQLEELLSRSYKNKVVKIHNSIRPVIKQPTPLATKIVIGIAGRLVRVKRVDIFIDMVNHLSRNEHMPQFEAWIIGDGPLRHELESQAKRLQVDSLVNFTGFINPVIPKLQKLDLLIMCSDHEGLPITLLEALSLGVPIIAHRTGGIPEVLCNGEAGVLISEHTPTSYSKAVIDLVSDPVEMKKLSYKSKKHFNNKFNLDITYRYYVDLYENLTQ